jgi:hypothetical protein
MSMVGFGSLPNGQSRMAGSKPNRKWESAVPNFSTVLRIVAALSILSAILAVGVAVLNARLPVPFADQLVHEFMETFKTGIIAIIGLLGGRGLQKTRR